MRFLKKYVTVKGAIGGFGFFAGLISSLGYIMEKFAGSEAGIEPFVWACTVALFTLTISLGAAACSYSQFLKQDEIDRLCKIKAELEGLILGPAFSSQGRKSE